MCCTLYPCFRIDQVERSYAVDKFNKGEKDVLCATDVASKGLDFPDVQHVINYDLPEDTENYGNLTLHTDRCILLKPFLFQFIELGEQVVVDVSVSLRLLSIKHVVKYAHKLFYELHIHISNR